MRTTVMLELLAIARNTVGLRIFFGFCLLVVLSAAVYVVRNRKTLFVRSGDRSTDSPAAGNLRMAMVVLVLLHAAVLLIITIVELS